VLTPAFSYSGSQLVAVVACPVGEGRARMEGRATVQELALRRAPCVKRRLAPRLGGQVTVRGEAVACKWGEQEITPRPYGSRWGHRLALHPGTFQLVATVGIEPIVLSLQVLRDEIPLLLSLGDGRRERWLGGGTEPLEVFVGVEGNRIGRSLGRVGGFPGQERRRGENQDSQGAGESGVHHMRSLRRTANSGHRGVENRVDPLHRQGIVEIDISHRSVHSKPLDLLIPYPAYSYSLEDPQVHNHMEDRLSDRANLAQVFHRGDPERVSRIRQIEGPWGAMVQLHNRAASPWSGPDTQRSRSRCSGTGRCSEATPTTGIGDLLVTGPLQAEIVVADEPDPERFFAGSR